MFSQPVVLRFFVSYAAEDVGFEPTEPCSSPVFKTGAFDHSAISPVCLIRYSLNADANIKSFFALAKAFSCFLFLVIFYDKKQIHFNQQL